MIVQNVDCEKPYRILIERGLLQNCGKLVAEVIKPCTAALITDDIVDKLWGDIAARSLEESGFRVVRIVFENGERSKNMQTLSDILEQLAENGLTRSDCIVALGGGVTGDIAGFAAAVYMRGIKFVQIPTTLLAAVDSSVGGKTAVDLTAGKNLAGAFWQPSLVICDPDVLETLPRERVLDGLGEVVKYAFGFDDGLTELLKSGELDERVDEIIRRSVAIKANVVSQDELDRGERQKLNLGHTVGHAIERCSAYSVTHGQAVAIGLVIITRACVKRGLLPESELSALLGVMEKLGMSTECEYNAAELSKAALGDKKRSGGEITLILPCGGGKCRLQKTDISELEGWISDGLDGTEL